jgi:nicotinamide-nucleotide amidase
MSGTARFISPDLAALAGRVLALACERRLGVVTAESCTSGLLATALSEAPGAGEYLHGGFVTYTKANKTAALGVSGKLLSGPCGAVCPEVAVAMAEGALARSPADIAIAITGVAGPDKDEDGNPVGLVCIAVGRTSLPTSVVERNYGDIGRDAVRERAMIDALREVERLLVVA